MALFCHIYWESDEWVQTAMGISAIRDAQRAGAQPHPKPTSSEQSLWGPGSSECTLSQEPFILKVGKALLVPIQK